MSENVTPPPPPSDAPPPPPAAGAAPPPPPPSGAAGGTESPNRTIMIVLAYLGILALIPLLVEKDDKEVQWHAKHGLVLLVLWVVVGIAFGVASAIPGLGCITGIIALFLPLPMLIIHIICIVKGVNGDRFLIPGISKYADQF